MRRSLRLLFVLACASMLVLGLVFGGLNSTAVRIDLYWLELEAGLGSALLAAALAGAVAAGLCLWLAVILPLQSRLARSQRTLARTTGALARTDAPQEPV
jgi:uncharacterized integral membrane protein